MRFKLDTMVSVMTMVLYGSRTSAKVGINQWDSLPHLRVMGKHYSYIFAVHSTLHLMHLN